MKGFLWGVAVSAAVAIAWKLYSDAIKNFDNQEEFQ